MKLLYLYRYCILGGVSTQLANRLRYLSPRAEVHLLFLSDHGGRNAFAGHPHVHVVNGPQAVQELVASGGYDAVIPIDTPAVLGPIHRSGYRGPLINEVHTTTRNLRYLDDLHGDRVTAFLAPSAYLAGRIRDEFGFADEIPCHHVPNCLDMELFQPRPVERAVRRKIVLWIGKLDDHKNWRGFVEAAAALRDRRDDCEFWMVGGETAPESVALELFDYVADLGLSGRLRWLQRVEYEDMPRLYALVAASGGLTLSTSRDESFGMTVAESLACGCPAAAAAVGALPEMLGEADVGEALYPYFEIEELVRVVEAILERTAQERSLVAERGRRFVVDHYSIDIAGQLYLKTLQEICDTAASAATGGGGREGA